MTDLEAVVRWCVVLGLIVAAAAPLVIWLARPLPSRGAGIVVPLALLVVVWPSWFLSAGFGTPFATVGLWATAVMLGAAGWAWRRRGLPPAVPWRPYVAASSVWLAAFLAAVWLRGFTPDLTGTEKPMDAAFLSAGSVATTMPPADPWFAGEPINYYYLGYVLFGSVARMADIPATTAYNLAIPTLFASVLVAAGGFGWDALRPFSSRRIAAVAAVSCGLLVAIAGNLYAPLALLRNGASTVEAWWWDGEVGIGWRSSRIVCDGPRTSDERCVFPSIETINEFPFFSFLLADLHPHVMALPLTLTVLALALARLRFSGNGPSLGWSILAGAVAGSLYAANSWDFPTFLLALLGATWLIRDRPIRRRIVETAVVVAAAVAAWLPFWVRFDPPTGPLSEEAPGWLRDVPIVPRLVATVGVHAGERSSLGEFLTVFGAPLLFCGWLVGTALAHRKGDGRARVGMPLWVIGALGAVGVAAVILQAPALLLTGGLAIAATLLLLDGSLTGPRLPAVALVGLASAICAVVELVYLRDVFDSRMNTLFKVYYQAWTLYGLAAGVAVVVLWQEARRPAARAVVAAVGAMAAAAVLAYPVVASWQWTEGFAARRGLDGIAYAAERYPDEHAAILFLRDRARPGDIVLEAAGCSYLPNGDLPFGRVSAYTGVPTIVGWAGHERQWRAGQPLLVDEIAPRQADVARAFAEPDGPVVDRYGIDWIVAGRYETGDWRSECDAAGPYEGTDRAGFPGTGWSLAFERPTVRVWQRDRPATEDGSE